MKKILLLFSIVLVLLLAAGASADTIYPLTFGNSAISGYTGPYAYVDVHLTDSTHATITFTSNTVGGNIYLLGDGTSAGVNVNATSWTIATIAGTNAGTGFTPGPFSDGGSGNISEFGTLNQAVNSFDGFTHSADTISFVLTNTSGTWGSDSVVLIANLDGYLAAAHIFVTASPANGSNGALDTGFAGNGPPIPEPATMLLLGSGLIGLAGFARRRFKK